MATHQSTYEPKSGAEKWLDERLPVMRMEGSEQIDDRVGIADDPECGLGKRRLGRNGLGGGSSGECRERQQGRAAAPQPPAFSKATLLRSPDASAPEPSQARHHVATPQPPFA